MATARDRAQPRICVPNECVSGRLSHLIRALSGKCFPAANASHKRFGGIASAAAAASFRAAARLPPLPPQHKTTFVTEVRTETVDKAHCCFLKRDKVVRSEIPQVVQNGLNFAVLLQQFPEFSVDPCRLLTRAAQRLESHTVGKFCR